MTFESLKGKINVVPVPVFQDVLFVVRLNCVTWTLATYPCSTWTPG